MSLRFFFGPSGSGKSHQIYTEIIERSMENPRQNFLVIVPDQFTMQTQKELVTMHGRGGIMNIDVLSFGRLSHRVFEEVGGEDIPVLDDTGKSLVLQRVAASVKERLPVLGSHLHKQGYIHEVKSAISEFMQYGIGTEDVSKLITFAEKRGALFYKLKDLELLYRSFMEYIEGHFITKEEKLDVLRKVMHKSAVVRDSVIVFDGFTGFTPIQNRLIQELMKYAQEVIVSVTLGKGEDPYKPDEEQKLFHLSKKTVQDLEKLAAEIGVERGKDVVISAELLPRFRNAQALQWLESHLFRAGAKTYEGQQDAIHIMDAPSLKEEVHQAGLQILKLIREKGYQYRDIAVISGNLESYAAFVEGEFSDMGIPCYIDRTRGIVLNPMTQFMKSALDLFIKDFTYEAVFHYLRSGLTDFTMDEVDRLENYILQTGIRGYHKWQQRFTAKTMEMGEDEDLLLAINDLRERFVTQVSGIAEVVRKAPAAEKDGGKSSNAAAEREVRRLSAGRAAARDFVENLYEFIIENNVQNKLKQLEDGFNGAGDLTRAKEYAQIYRLVMELLDQIYELLGEEEITRQEFLDILEAGFGEIEVGTIPQNVDRILVGDIERTRLKQVRALFFLGVNDGNIPKNASKGGIISDVDREFLSQSQLELAPSPRQQMYIQRFYLYLNLTKPSEYLYLSFAKVSSEGKTLRPSYLIDTIQKVFVDLEVEQPWNQPVLDQIVTPNEGIRYLAEGLREYAENDPSRLDDKEFYSLYAAYKEREVHQKQLKLLTEAAFLRYRESGMAKAVARALYGSYLVNSVSRLETYAACAYRHFLQYGLSLKEREEFDFEAVDMGNVFHGVLDEFSRRLEDSDYTWMDFPEEFGQRNIAESMESFAAGYGAGVLYSSARNEYAITRMNRILLRTVNTLQNHLKKGDFMPEGHEISFRFTDNMDSVNIALTKEEKMRLQGRIDRIDTAEDAERVYVKVIDYKSGNRQFDMAAVYHGLQLQLVVYMNAAMEIEAKKHPDKEVVPAALLYYHVDDPLLETAQELTPEEINTQLLQKLRMNGVVNADLNIVEKLDHFMADKSDVIPVEKKKDGTFSARSSIMSQEEMRMVSNYVNLKIRKIGREILAGHTEINPYEKGALGACTYCSYKKVCGFDPAIPGYKKRTLEELSQENALKKMEEELA